MITDLMRWDPFRDLATLREEMARATPTGIAGAPWRPVCDVIDAGDGIVITAELPGVKDEDVEISVHDGLLTIRGERRLEDEVREDRVHRLERSYGAFARSFRLPEGVREEDIHASVAYGVLRITIPTAAPRAPRRVPVTAG